MAATIGTRQITLDTAPTRVLPSVLPPNVSVSGDVTGTIGGRSVNDILNDLDEPNGDITKDILENSGTAIVVTSSNLFTFPGTGQAGLFVGSGGIIGRNLAGDVTFSIDTATGNAEFEGSVKSGSVIAETVQLSNGRTLAQIDADAQVGDDTIDILQNSGTAIVVTSSNLFTYPGVGSAGLFVGSGGLIGRNIAGDVTFSINSANGNATFAGTVAAGSVLVDTITLQGSGRTLALIDADSQIKYTTADLEADLEAGVGNVLAGTGGNYTLNIDKDNSLIVLSHKDAVYNGTASTGTNKPALAISSAGIAMGYNRSSDGAWINSIAINASGDASFAGTVAAGSFLADSATLLTSGRTLAQIDADSQATGYTKTQLEADLASGVGSVLAGSGANYILDVNQPSGLVAFRHKDAVYEGTAAPGSNKPALAISASGIAMGYNRSSDGAWVNSVSISAAGNASFGGTVTGGSIISTNVGISGTLLTFQDVVDKVNEPPPTGDNTVSILQNSGTTITMSSSNLFKTTTGLGGVFIGGGGLFGRNTSGGTTFSIDGATGAATFAGTITGGSDINISGQARFRGNTTVLSVPAACHINESNNSTNGIVAYSNSGIAVQGLGTGTNGDGIYGQADGSGAEAVVGFHSNQGVAVRGIASGTGYGIYSQGHARVTKDLTVDGTLIATVANATNATFATTAGTANSVSASNITGSINAATLGSRSSTEYCYRNLCNANGYTAVSGGDVGVRITGTLFDTVQTRASGNTVFIENKSDISLKTNIRPEYFGSDFIKKLKPCVFELKDRMGIDTHGFIAQEVAAEIPATDSLALKNEGSELWGVSDTGLMSVAVNTIQEILTRLEAAESKITTLQAEVNLLKGI